MAQCPAVGGAVADRAAAMTGTNKRFGEVLSDEVFLNKAFLKRITQIHSLLRKGYEVAAAGRPCLISIDPVC
jgi:hypothetical protein